jgi:hypothetical protein
VSYLEDEPNPHVVRVGWSADYTSMQLGKFFQLFYYTYLGLQLGVTFFSGVIHYHIFYIMKFTVIWFMKLIPETPSHYPCFPIQMF